MSKSNYLKYIIPFQLIYDKIKVNNYKNVIFYIDLLSISRGFYNKEVINLELANYVGTKEMPTLFIDELKIFLNNLYSKFKFYNPKFVIFFDNGECIQNTTINKFYKENRASDKYFYLEENQKELMRGIKNYYLNRVNEEFNKKGLSYILYSKQYELDLIPHFVISNNYLNSKDNDTLNIILSIDKDLLQTLVFRNTVQAVSTYRKSTGVELNLFDFENAISYIFSGFKRGGLTAEFIPLILAMAGDKIDGIKSVPSVGVSTAIKYIQMYNLPHIVDESTVFGLKLENYKGLIIDNLKLTCFNKQIERLPIQEINKFNKVLSDE
jgi:5'-3' exonuclease